MKCLRWSSFFRKKKKRYGILIILPLTLLLYYMGKPSGALLSDIDFSRVVYTRDKEVLRITLSKDDKYRLFVHSNAAGSLIKKAVLLKEDQYFYYHPGVNPVSVLRAIIETYIRRSTKMGASTITMQLARLYYGLNTKTITGKLQQMAYAVYLELYYSKDDILEAYLNLAPCGGNVEGFAAAAMLYFKKELWEINLQEALFLSVLPQSPSKYPPKNQKIPPELTQARLRLYKLWRDNQAAQPTSEAVAHSTMPLNTSYFTPYRAPHFTRSVLNTVTKEKRVYTTLDWKLQKLVTRLTRQYVQRKKSLGVENAAVLLVDYKNTMEVRASLGSADFFNAEIQGQVDGTRARRSPGSTLKPMIYALAMDQGLIHPMTVVKDAPTSFSSYAPDNYERDFKGPIKAWEALINSRNVPAVSLASKLHNPDLYDLLKTLNLGDLKPKEHYGLSIVLGSAELSMRELVSLYGILANKGVFQNLNDTYSTEVHQNRPIAKPFLSREASWLTQQILRQNPKPNSNTLVAYGNSYTPESPTHAIGYKTGTSIGFKDCWSVAIFDQYILAVWLGNFDGYGNGVFNGRQLASPLLFEIATNILQENAKVSDRATAEDVQQPPPGIREVSVCAASGLLAHPHCKRKLPTYFIPGTSSIQKCDICRKIYVHTKTGYRAYEAGDDVHTEVYEFWPTDILAIFRKAGVPRKTPPMYEPRETKENFDQHAEGNRGFAPNIVSPMAKTEYLLSPGEALFNNLPLKATVDADVTEVYWFVDEQFIGRSDPRKTQFWSLQPGIFQISVVDDKGRSASRTVKIGVAMN